MKRKKKDSIKSEATRKKIFNAARTVFAKHPYNAASMRMIGKEGSFDHTIIRYYFPSKAVLFESIIADLCIELQEACISWFDGMSTVSPLDGLESFIGYMLNYYKKTPAGMRIIMQNIAQAQSDSLDSIPGYSYIPGLLENLRETFHKRVPLKASESEVKMFVDSFNTLVIHYLGAGSCQAQILGMESDSPEYFQWVKNTLVFVFLPLLNRLLGLKKD